MRGSGAATAAEIAQGAAEVVGRGLVSASVDTVAYGGSFGQALEGSVASDLATIGASATGQLQAQGFFDGSAGELGYLATHAALGCAAGAAEGTGCGGGAIGGAASAALTPLLAGAIDPQQTPLTNGQTAALGAFGTLVGGTVAGLAGANAQAGAQAGQNEALNNTGPHWGQPTNQTQAGQLGQQPGSSDGLSSTSNPLGNAATIACVGGLQPCNTQLLQTIVQAQGANATVAGQNLETMGMYGAPLLGVALLGPEALTAAGLAGVYDYTGDAYSYATGLSKDTPNFTKSYITGIIGGLTYPFAIADETIAGMGTAGKIAANGYNGLVAGTGAFGAAAVAHQDSPDISGGFGAGAAGSGGLVKSLFPGSLGNFLNSLIQGAAGPLQNAITQGGSGK
ncbi:DUF637 domain-containing protein [Trinickia symbiotica]|uniref:DUF637 domain-containing protein n=1 Tax=Trinickia symbiotica TaxID=863227 RepID=UPI000379B8EA|nr:DUF637 domain-containing protein [Trinickia symbiotica]